MLHIFIKLHQSSYAILLLTMEATTGSQDMDGRKANYRKVSNISGTKSQNLNASRLTL